MFIYKAIIVLLAIILIASGSGQDVSGGLRRDLSGKKKGKKKGLFFHKRDQIGMIEYDADATPDTFFGSGNTNGYFTCNRSQGVEICLRAKQRFPKTNPNGLWSNGDGTYRVTAGDSCPDKFSWITEPDLCKAIPIWSFEWTINTDWDPSASTGNTISAFTYELGMGCGTKDDSDSYSSFGSTKQSSYTTLFPFETTLNTLAWDHDFSDGTTIDDVARPFTAAKTVEFTNFMNTNNAAQQSWNYFFFVFPGTCLWTFDPKTEDTYKIYLLARDKENGRVVAKTTIAIITDLDQGLESDVTTPAPP